MTYEVKDPWRVRIFEALTFVFVCSHAGHDRPKAFKGGFKPCRRCNR